MRRNAPFFVSRCNSGRPLLFSGEEALHFQTWYAGVRNLPRVRNRPYAKLLQSTPKGAGGPIITSSCKVFHNSPHLLPGKRYTRLKLPFYNRFPMGDTHVSLGGSKAHLIGPPQVHYVSHTKLLLASVDVYKATRESSTLPQKKQNLH